MIYRCSFWWTTQLQSWTCCCTLFSAGQTAFLIHWFRQQANFYPAFSFSTHRRFNGWAPPWSCIFFWGPAANTSKWTSPFWVTVLPLSISLPHRRTKLFQCSICNTVHQQDSARQRIRTSWRPLSTHRPWSRKVLSHKTAQETYIFCHRFAWSPLLHFWI